MAGLLLLFALASHWPVRRGFFQVDDFVWLDLANWHSVAASFIGSQGAHIAYRPIFRLSMYLDALVFGQNALPWHLENVVLHAITALLVAVLLRSWRLPRSLAASAAILFDLAPLSGESVNWISGRTTILCLMFLLLSVWWWTFSLNARRLPWGATIWMLLAAMSYEAAVALPAMLFCLVPLANKRFGIRWSYAVRHTLLLTGVLVGFWLLRAIVLGTLTGQTDVTGPDFSENLRLRLSILGLMNWQLGGPILTALLVLAFVLCTVIPRLCPAGPCLAAIAAVSLAPYMNVAGTGGRFFYILQVPLCVLIVLPALLLRGKARIAMLGLLLGLTLPRLAFATWQEAASFTAAGIETREMITAIRAAISGGDRNVNVIDNVPELDGGQIMMGDFFEVGVAYFYEPKPAPVIMRTRTALYFPKVLADVLAAPTRFWRYHRANKQVVPIRREDWLSAYPETHEQ